MLRPKLALVEGARTPELSAAAPFVLLEYVDDFAVVGVEGACRAHEARSGVRVFKVVAHHALRHNERDVPHVVGAQSVRVGSALKRRHARATSRREAVRLQGGLVSVAAVSAESARSRAAVLPAPPPRRCIRTQQPHGHILGAILAPQ